MNYNEKLKIADNYTSLIIEGKSFDFVKNSLREEGFAGYDINQIISSIENILYEKYENEIINSLEKNKLENNLTKFSNLDDSVFNYLESRAIKNLRKEKRKIIKKLLHDRVKTEDIINAVKSVFYTEQEIKDYINWYQNKNPYLKPKIRIWNIVYGIIFIFLGLNMFLFFNRYFGAILFLLVGILLFIEGNKD